MTSFKTFLLNERLSSVSDIETFIKLVKQNCSEYLKHEGTLYRGEKTIKKDFFRNTIRLDRRPLSTPVQAHNDLDELFNRQFGFKYRSGSAFSLNTPRTLNAFGEQYIIFPIDGYTLCGSKKVDDLWLIVDDRKAPLSFLFSESILKKVFNNEELKKYYKMTNFDINKNDLSTEDKSELLDLNYKIFKDLEYFESKNPNDYPRLVEIMVKSKAYYGLKTNFPSSYPIKYGEILSRIYEK